eukprot:3912388-Prymnesium_polylepis.1
MVSVPHLLAQRPLWLWGALARMGEQESTLSRAALVQLVGSKRSCGFCWVVVLRGLADPRPAARPRRTRGPARPCARRQRAR